MALQDLEVNVGGTSFKGVYIAVLLSFASTLAGGIWAASEFFSRLEAQEEAVVNAGAEAKVLGTQFDNLIERTNEALQEYEVAIANMQQAMDDNDVRELKSKLTELGTNLAAIMEAQKELLDLRDRVSAVEMSNAEAVLKIDNRLQALNNIDERMKRIQREIDDLWDGLDSVANPLG